MEIEKIDARKLSTDAQKELRNNTEKYMLSIQNNPQKVANFFKHPKVQYAG